MGPRDNIKEGSMMMNTTRWSLLLTLLISTGCGDCGDDGNSNNSNNPKPDMSADMTAGDMSGDMPQGDMDPDMEGDMADMGADTVAPTVSITSGMSADAAGAYRLEGAFMDDRGVTALTYSIDGAAPIAIDPIASPFGVDLTLAADATIVVTAADAAGNEATASVMVSVPEEGELVADFTVSPMPSSYLPVIFDASGSNDPLMRSLTYAWDFGDNSTGEGVQAGHLYRAAGTYTVKLVVSAGGVSAMTEREITVADPAPAGMATLHGNVLDAAGAPVSGVDVFDRQGMKLATTDGSGRFDLMAGTGTPLVYVFRRDDYTTQVLRTELPAGTQTSNTSVFMTPRSLPVFLLDAAAGGTVAGPLGSRIEFQADGLVDDETGMPVTGPVAVTITPINHNDGQTRAFPGRFEAALPDGSIDALASYGLVEVTLSQNGRKVQLAPGKPATVEVPYTVDQGQAGDMIPFWSLDERTGLWVQEQALAPIQQASGGTGLVQRATISHFSWLNIDKAFGTIGNLPTAGIDFEFIHNNTPITESVDLDLNYDRCVAPARSSARTSSAKSGDTISSVLTNCEAGVNARSASGRYFAEAVINTGDASAPIRVEMTDANALTLLSPNNPVTGTLQNSDKLYYAFDATAAHTYAIRLRSANGATLNGQARLLPPNRVARPAQTFDASKNTNTFAAATEDGLWVVEISAASGTGGFSIELIADPAPLLNDAPVQTLSLAQGASRDLLVRGSQADLARIVATGSPALNLTLLDSREQPVLTASAGAADTGLLRFKNGGVYIVRVTNTGAQTDATVTYSAAAPPRIVMPQPRLSLQRTLEPGQIEVFILPHYSDAAVVARAANAMSGAAPQVSVYSSKETAFPNPALDKRQLRSPNDAEAIAAMRLPAVTPEYGNAAFIYVSMADALGADYTIDLDLVRKSPAIKAGGCQDADTPSLFAASIALEDNGVLTACAEDHATFAGLRFSQPRFTLRGLDRTQTKLNSWPNAQNGISTGIYGENALLNTTSATIEDVTILNRQVGISLTPGTSAQLSIQRADIIAATPITNIGSPTKCVETSAQPGSMGVITVADSSCTNTQEALNLNAFEEVTVRQNSFSTSERGVVVSNIKNATISQNTFAGAVQAVIATNHAGLMTILGNVINQGPGSSNLGGIAINVALRSLAATNPTRLHTIQNNTITLQGSGSVGIAAGYNTAPGDLLIDGNKISGTGAAQVGVRLLASATNIIGGVVTIQNNILHTLGLHAIHVLQTDAISRVNIFNNSMRMPDINAAGESVINLATLSGNGAGTAFILNNIFSGGSATLLGPNAVAYINSIAVTRDYNLFFQITTPYRPSGLGIAPGANTHDITDMDPQFTNDDLVVGANSPAVNAGTDMNGVPTTAYGAAMRPVGAAHDIGAHER
jgi:PKD repeat protein